MAASASKNKPTLLPTNLCITWGLYHIRRYRDKAHRIVKVDKQVMIEGTGVNSFDMRRFKGGFEALNSKNAIGAEWTKKVELEITISNLWD